MPSSDNQFDDKSLPEAIRLKCAIMNTPPDDSTAYNDHETAPR